MADMIVLHIVHDFLFNFVYLKIVCIPTLACLLVNFIQASYANKSLLIYKKKVCIQNELIYKTESQTSKTNLWLPKGKGGQGREQLGVWGCSH